MVSVTLKGNGVLGTSIARVLVELSRKASVQHLEGAKIRTGSMALLKATPGVALTLMFVCSVALHGVGDHRGAALVALLGGV